MQVSKIISIYLLAVPRKLYEVERERAFGTKSESRSVISDSLRPHGLQPTTLLHPWDFPGKSTAVGCHFLLKQKSQPKKQCPQGEKSHHVSCASSNTTLFFFFFNFYNIMLVSCVQQSDLIIYIGIYIYLCFLILFHYRLL